MPRAFDRLGPYVVGAALASASLVGCKKPAPSTTPAVQTAPGTLDSTRMLDLLRELADDALGGRYTLHPDIREATAVIATRYRAAGVAPGTDDGYTVDYGVRVGIDPGPENHLKLRGPKGASELLGSAIVPLAEGGNGTAEGPVVFVGYGIVHDGDGFDELGSVPVRDAIAVLLAGTPPTADDGPSFGRRDGTLSRKLSRLADAGAAGVIVIDPLGAPPPDLSADRALRRHVDIPVVQLASDDGAALAAAVEPLRKTIDERRVPASQALPGWHAELRTDFSPREIAAPNMIAVVPGTDLAHEIVLVGAHLDHIGTAEEGHGHCRAITEPKPDAICNGADDNGSGSAIVAELAMSFSQAPVAPRRTLVFVHFSGEEMGLLGSRHLASQVQTQAPFAGRTIVAMLNIDMVGRLRERLTVSGVDSAAAWMPMLDEVGPRGMRVMYDRSLTTRSDHAPFYELGVPALFFFTEIHDDYHAPGDEFSGIVQSGVVSVAELVAELTRRLGDGAAIEFREPTDPQFGLVPALPGDNPAAVIKEVGPSEPGPSATGS